MLEAVTFDLWDTLVIDDSDEADRAAAGLLPKPEARAAAFAAWAVGRGADEAAARAALEAANAWFRVRWKQHHRTPHIRDRLLEAAGRLGLDADDGFDGVVHAFATMEVDHPPRLTPGAREMLQALHGRVPLAIISDAIVTPGSGLRAILSGHGLLQYFDATIFSDEAGAAKPDRRVFDAAADALGVTVTGLVHVGDREANDIAGPQGVGARGVLYTGAVDRGSATSKADAICAHHDGMVAILDSLGGLP